MREREITVDIGCGKRNNLFFYGFGSEPTLALDINRRFLNHRINGSHASNLLEADAQNLPLPTGSADQVFAIHVLEHVQDLKDSLDEIDRILKPGGKITIAVPHPNFESVMGRIEDKYFSDQMHNRVISKKQLTTELENRSFSVAVIKQRNFVSAAYLTMTYFIHRRVLRDRIMESQSGDLIPDNSTPSEKQNTKSLASLIRRMVEKVLLKKPMSRVLNWLDKLYPFETYVEARKVN